MGLLGESQDGAVHGEGHPGRIRREPESDDGGEELPGGVA